MSAYEIFGPIFRPRVVAVVGASASGGVSPGNEFIRHCLAFGFDGRLVPIHHSAATVEGLASAKSFAEIGETIDFAYVAVGARSPRGAHLNGSWSRRRGAPTCGCSARTASACIRRAAR